MPQDNINTTTLDKVLTASSMLERLHNIDINSIDLNIRANHLKGNMVWLFAFTVPLSAILLAVLTFLGIILGLNFIISFIIAALLIYFIAKIIDGYDKQFIQQSRINTIETIATIEGDLGLIHHFKEFLPNKYRHLWQSTRKKNFMYIPQYKEVIILLQNNLEQEKFIKLWHVKYPKVDPDYQAE